MAVYLLVEKVKSRIMVLFLFTMTALITQLQGLPYNDVVNLAKKWAPRVFLTNGEGYYPSSVDFFLQHVNIIDKEGIVIQKDPTTQTIIPGQRNYFLESKESLHYPSCTNLGFFKGQKPVNRVPTYVFYREPEQNMFDQIYFFFFPYNRGQRLCIGIRADNLCLPGFKILGGCLHKPINGCIGQEITFGHHVGDWEHISVRLVNKKPHSIYLSVHHFGHLYRYEKETNSFQRENRTVELENGHPVVYCAEGSHGMWSSPGAHDFMELCNKENLTDHTQKGVAWNTWLSLRVIKIVKTGLYQGANRPFNFLGRWGNREKGCDVLKQLSGECVLNGGPEGPTLKTSITTAFPLTKLDEVTKLHNAKGPRSAHEQTLRIKERLFRRRRFLSILNLPINKLQDYAKELFIKLCPM